MNQPYTREAVQAILLTKPSDRPWCNKHLTSFVGTNKQTGSPWTKCNRGFQTGEPCEIRTD